MKVFINSVIAFAGGYFVADGLRIAGISVWVGVYVTIGVALVAFAFSNVRAPRNNETEEGSDQTEELPSSAD